MMEMAHYKHTGNDDDNDGNNQMKQPNQAQVHLQGLVSILEKYKVI